MTALDKAKRARDVARVRYLTAKRLEVGAADRAEKARTRLRRTGWCERRRVAMHLRVLGTTFAERALATRRFEVAFLMLENLLVDIATLQPTPEPRAFNVQREANADAQTDTNWFVPGVIKVVRATTSKPSGFGAQRRSADRPR